jgi:hypothetical protein
MRRVLICAALVGLGLTALAVLRPSAPGRQRPVPVVMWWDGAVSGDLRSRAPAAGFVADAEAWAKLWAAYRDGDVPDIDFDTHLVLFALSEDLNQITITPTVDERGRLTPDGYTTQMAYADKSRFGYQFAVIGRAGITAVGAVPVPIR